MPKSILTIQKEMLRRDYAKTPLGIVEKKLKNFYDQLILKGESLPENVAKMVSDIRDNNEKEQMDYIEQSQRENREMVDSILLKSMEAEWEILTKYKNNAYMSIAKKRAPRFY